MLTERHRSGESGLATRRIVLFITGADKRQMTTTPRLRRDHVREISLGVGLPVVGAWA